MPKSGGKGSNNHGKAQAASTAWEQQAEWYDQRHGQHGDRWHEELLIPAILRQLNLQGERLVIDCCCGQGVVARAVAAQGAEVIGVDAAPSLIEAASSVPKANSASAIYLVMLVRSVRFWRRNSSWQCRCRLTHSRGARPDPWRRF